MTDARTCAHCAAVLPRPVGPGRPRTTCDDTCRRAHLVTVRRTKRHEAAEEAARRRAVTLAETIAEAVARRLAH